MAIAKSAWGIDIGNRALKAIQLVRDGDKLRVGDLEVIEHEQILSSAGDNRESLIQSAMANFIQRHPTLKQPVAVGVSGQSSFARFIKLPPVEPKKIPEIVRFEAIQQIPFPLDEVEWAYQLFQAADSPDVEVGIFAMRKELINRHIKFFTDLNMNVQVVQMNPLAVYSAMVYDGRLSGTTMVIDMGAENTDLIIADGQTVWLRTIPVGGNNFTETLAKSFKLSFAKAEDLKRNAGTSKYARQIFQAMRPVFADLVAEIQRSIGFYASVNRDSRIKKIIALGGTFRLPTLQKYLYQNLQVDVERPDGFGAGAPDDGRMAAVLNDNLASMVSAYGLALQAMGEAKITSSLLPEPIRKARIWKEKTKWFGAAAALFVIGTSTSYASWYYQRTQFQANGAARDRIDLVLSRAGTLNKDWNDIQNFGAGPRQHILNYETLPKYRDTWDRLMGDIVALVPRSDANEMKLPRAQRRQIVIQDILRRYEPSIGNILRCSPDVFRQISFNANGAETVGGSYAALPMPGRPSRNEARGFLLTIHCTSPNGDNPQFVEEGFVKGLLKVTEPMALGTGRSYYIARAAIVSAIQVKQDQDKIDKANDAKRTAEAAAAKVAPRTDAAPTQAIEGRSQAVVPSGESAVPDPLADPVTSESTLDDWEFTILVAVVLDPKVAESPAASPAAAH